MTRLFALTLALILSSCTKSSPPETALVPLTVAQVRELASAKTSVVNIWATWCEPCRREMPELVRFAKANPEIQVVLINADEPAKFGAAEKFLSEAGVGFKSYRMGEPIEIFSKNLEPRWTVVLPATFLFDSKGQLSTFWVGETTEKELKTKVASLSGAHLATPRKIESDTKPGK